MKKLTRIVIVSDRTLVLRTRECREEQQSPCPHCSADARPADEDRASLHHVCDCDDERSVGAKGPCEKPFSRFLNRRLPD
jgi:hypothetical protein